MSSFQLKSWITLLTVLRTQITRWSCTVCNVRSHECCSHSVLVATDSCQDPLPPPPPRLGQTAAHRRWHDEKSRHSGGDRNYGIDGLTENGQEPPGQQRKDIGWPWEVNQIYRTQIKLLRVSTPKLAGGFAGNLSHNCTSSLKPCIQNQKAK